MADDDRTVIAALSVQVDDLKAQLVEREEVVEHYLSAYRRQQDVLAQIAALAVQWRLAAATTRGLVAKPSELLSQCADQVTRLIAPEKPYVR